VKRQPSALALASAGIGVVGSAYGMARYGYGLLLPAYGLSTAALGTSARDPARCWPGRCSSGSAPRCTGPSRSTSS
jgi:hypothetical protein